MNANRRVLMSLALLLAIAATSAIDAIRTEHWALVVLAAVSMIVTGGLLATMRDRRAVRLRADLATWVTRTTAATGEPPERMVDRAVSAYRAELDGTDGRDG